MFAQNRYWATVAKPKRYALTATFGGSASANTVLSTFAASPSGSNYHIYRIGLLTYNSGSSAGLGSAVGIFRALVGTFQSGVSSTRKDIRQFPVSILGGFSFVAPRTPDNQALLMLGGKTIPTAGLSQKRDVWKAIDMRDRITLHPGEGLYVVQLIADDVDTNYGVTWEWEEE